MKCKQIYLVPFLAMICMLWVIFKVTRQMVKVTKPHKYIVYTVVSGAPTEINKMESNLTEVMFPAARTF